MPKKSLINDRKTFLYMSIVINDEIDLQESLSLEEYALFCILRTQYFKKKGFLPVGKMVDLMQKCNFKGNPQIFVNMVEETFYSDGSYYKNQEWDRQIKDIEKRSKSASENAKKRWQKSKKNQEKKFLKTSIQATLF